MNIKELEVLFYDESRNEFLPFVVNDPVEVLEGDDRGKFGVVISISSADPELTYLVEKGDGSGDIVVSAKALRLM